MNALGLVAGMFGLVVIAVAADYSGDAWRFFKPISLPPGQAEDTFVEIVPDHEVFAHTLNGLADLRVIEAASQTEVPYKLLVERGESRRTAIGGSVEDLGTVSGAHTSFVLDLGAAGVRHNEVEIRTPSRNFQRHVTVETSSDRVSWVVSEEGGQIFDFTIDERDFTARDTTVRYPVNTARFLRVRITNATEPPLTVSGAVVHSSQELVARELLVPMSIVNREENAGASTTSIVLDASVVGQPVHRIEVTTTQDNFYRQVQVEGSNNLTEWTPLGGADLFAISTERFVGQQLQLTFAESRFRYYRLTVLNLDDDPLFVSGAAAYGTLRKLIFPASPGGDYRLYYGNSDAREPSYELERIFPYLVTDNLPQAALGSETANPAFVAPLPPLEPEEPFTERYPWFLPLAVAVGALVLGLFLTRLLREIKKVFRPPDEEPPANGTAPETE